MNLLTIATLLSVALLCGVNAVSDKVVYCYYGTWATYRWGDGKFDVENINPDLCTHIAYTFAGINNQGEVISLDPSLDLAENWGRDNFRKFTALKKKNPNLKTLLAVGGWNEGSAKYSVMAASPELRSNFVRSSLRMILDHGFDGLDLDWEYPNRRDTVYGAADVDNFSQLLKELRLAYDVFGLILTAAVSSVEQTASLSYDVPTISKYLDLINLMTYDYYGAWDPVTGHNSPLHKGEGDENTPEDELYTIDNAVEYWISAGAPPEKLVLGIPFYGRTFKLSNFSENGVRSPSSGVGIAGPYTVTNGLLGYNEFCLMLQAESWTVKYDSQAKVPYAYRDLNWVSFDDADSIAVKAEYAKSLNLGGLLLWSIETDDFRGKCGPDFPLLRAMNDALGQDVTPSTGTPVISSSTAGLPSSTQTSVSTDSPASSTTTAAPQTEESVCEEVGITPNPKDCRTYYICIQDAKGGLIAYKFRCPASLLWDQKHHICNYPEKVQCNV